MPVEIVELVVLQRPHEGAKADKPQKESERDQDEKNGQGGTLCEVSRNVFDLAQSISIGWTSWYCWPLTSAVTWISHCPAAGSAAFAE